MSEITFILGGARSGKSSYALGLAKACKKVAFIATCEPLDKEMRQRISLHKKSRPKHWHTFDEPRDICALLNKISHKYDFLIIDCLTLLISNLLIVKRNPEVEIKRILACLKKFKGKTAVVSNEVGLGIVPDTALGRAFRDIAGRINQTVAREAKNVYFMVSGIPWRIK